MFAAPTREAVALLAQKYGVHWLLVGRSISTESVELTRYATLVYETDGAAVYDIK